jgi:serine/threonine protein kinase/N-acetylneuraminic acid mutarotase
MYKEWYKKIYELTASAFSSTIGATIGDYGMVEGAMTNVQNSQNRADTNVQPDNLIGRTLRNGEYRVQRVLGHGGMGKVYLAAHTQLGTPFAIKQAQADQPLPPCVSDELYAILQGGKPESGSDSSPEPGGDFPTSGGVHTDRFLREALLLARLEHPAIPTLYDYFTQDGYWYLVMDYIPGPTLGAYLRQRPALLPLEALNYAMQLCDVLDYLHRQTPPIVFRDMKPSNIIVTPEKALMLVDFGISRYFKLGQVNDTVEFGSPGYAPPEQYQGHAQTDARSDLYSLGVLLHEMVTGKRPAGMGVPLSPPQSINPELSAAISGLIALATRAEPMYRFQSAQALYLALERVYTIEEWRAYQQQINKSGNATASRQMPASGVKFEPKQRLQGLMGESARPVSVTALPTEPLLASLWSANLQQRHTIRRTLQQTRQLPEEPVQASPTLEVVEDIQPIIEEKIVPQRPEKTSLLERLIQIFFALVLLVFLVLSSALTIFRAKDQQPPASQVTQQTASSVSKEQQELWKVLPSLPEPAADNAAVYVEIQGRPYIYLNGGYRSRKQDNRYDHNLYRYDILAARWEMLGNRLPGMLNNAAVADNQGRLFFTGGYSTESYSVVPALYIYQPANNNVRKVTLPNPLGYGGSMIADGQGHLYLTQGFMQAGQPEARAETGWYRYDVVSDQWQNLAPLPQGLGYTLLALDPSGGILLIGGASDAGQRLQSNQIYRYDTAHDSWKKLSITTPYALSGASGCMARPDQFVVVGGYDVSHEQSMSQTWVLDLKNLRWQSVASMPGNGSALGAVACDGNGKVYVERGVGKTNQPSQDFWQLVLPTRLPKQSGVDNIEN